MSVENFMEEWYDAERAYPEIRISKSPTSVPDTAAYSVIIQNVEVSDEPKDKGSF